MEGKPFTYVIILMLTVNEIFLDNKPLDMQNNSFCFMGFWLEGTLHLFLEAKHLKYCYHISNDISQTKHLWIVGKNGFCEQRRHRRYPKVQLSAFFAFRIIKASGTMNMPICLQLHHLHKKALPSPLLSNKL